MAGSSRISHIQRKLCCFSFCPPLWSFFSLNWMMINCYGPGTWSIQVCLVVWFVMVIDRFPEGKWSTFLFFLLKDWLFNHFTRHLPCSSTYNSGGHIWSCNTDKYKRRSIINVLKPAAKICPKLNQENILYSRPKSTQRDDGAASRITYVLIPLNIFKFILMTSDVSL